jgi:hypothetical protein
MVALHDGFQFGSPLSKRDRCQSRGRGFKSRRARQSSISGVEVVAADLSATWRTLDVRGWLNRHRNCHRVPHPRGRVLARRRRVKEPRIAGEYAILASRSASATGLPVSGRLRDCGSPFIRGSGLPVDGHTSPRGGGPEVAPQEAGVNVYHPRPSLRADVARRSRRAVWAHARVLARVSLSDR